MNVRREDDKVWVEGFDTYRINDPMFEGIRIILRGRGETHSPAYVQGIAGGAFRIAGICPCAPTCDNAMSPEALIRLLGYEPEPIGLPGTGDALAARVREVVSRVRREIDAGRAVLVWNAFSSCQYDVVYGYDEVKKLFLGRSCGTPNDPFTEADEARMASGGERYPTLGAILVGRRISEYRARDAEIAALQEAVRHARSQRNLEKLDDGKWVMLQGLACYDRWIRDFRTPDRKRELGDAYCYDVYRSTHRAAWGFLREIAPHYPRGAGHLRRAADNFWTEADILGKGDRLLWWSSPEGPDAARNAETVVLLQQARDEYAAGIAEIERALSVEGIGARD